MKTLQQLGVVGIIASIVLVVAFTFNAVFGDLSDAAAAVLVVVFIIWAARKDNTPEKPVTKQRLAKYKGWTNSELRSMEELTD